MNFKREHPLLLVFWRLCLLRQSPADLPASMFLLAVLVVVNFAVSVVSFVVMHKLFSALIQAIADLVITLGVVAVMLAVTARTARIMQTLIAVSGASIILNVMSLPLLFMLPGDGQPNRVVTMLLAFLLLWHIFVVGSIFRHVFESSLAMGTLLSMAYMVLVVTLFYGLFPSV